jgi:hypothetical protein
MTKPERSRPREASTRTLLKVATTTAVVGIALAASGDEDLARWLTLIGLVAMVVGLHRFGRLGADPALDLEPSPEP